MITIKSVLDELNEVLSSNIVNEDILDEKIMSKKKARRLKKKKIQKAKQAQLQKEQELQAQLQQDAEETPEEQPNAEETEDDSDEDEDTVQGTALVVYEGGAEDDEATEPTPEMKVLLEAQQQLSINHQQAIRKGMDMWKAAGENAACPQEAWDLMYNSLHEFKDGVEQAVDTYLQSAENATEAELTVVEQYMTAVDGYFKQAEQQLLGAKPNLSEEDLKVPAEQADGEVANTTGTDVATKTGTALATTTGTALTTTDDNLPDTPELHQKPDDNKNQSRDIVNYKDFEKGWAQTARAFDYLTEAIGKILGAPLKLLKNMALDMFTWFDKKIFGLLTSPLAKDIVKTLMYCNPLTAMIFDGDFGSFSLIEPLNKIKDAIAKKAQNAKSKKDDDKKYTKRGLIKPELLDKMNLKQLHKEFYGNRDMIDLINVSFNHKRTALVTESLLEKVSVETGEDNIQSKGTDNVVNKTKRNINNLKDAVTGNKSKKRKTDKAIVATDDAEVKRDDKARLVKYVYNIHDAFEKKEVSKVKTNFKAILQLLNEICDYMSWESPSQWKGLVNALIKKKGNNNDEIKSIYDKAKKVTTPKESKYDDKLLGRITSMIQDSQMSDADIASKLSKDYDEGTIALHIKKAHSDMDESYNVIRETNQLLENFLKELK